jgi:hemolysin III
MPSADFSGARQHANKRPTGPLPAVSHSSVATTIVTPSVDLASQPKKRTLLRAVLKPAEPFNAWSHLAAALLSLAAATPILLANARAAMIPASIIYSLSMIGLFLSSGALHTARSDETIARLENWDRALIYLLIAGTYTPPVQALLSSGWRMAILITIWGQALIGIVMVMIPRKKPLPRVLSTGLYLLMGWTLLLCIGQVWAATTTTQAFYMVAGAISYSVGAIVFAFRWPNPAPKHFGYHGIWHLFVIAGATFMFLFVLSLV